ncbi:MAG: hypothetical protein KME31_20900 [Tolypothrix carrinoi HA7290-LM1]|nr:hypothetical protein [Tolypothrix carrinoi HA7290-LM1]
MLQVGRPDGRCASAGKPLRQSLMGGTPKTALPYQRTASPTHWLTNYQFSFHHHFSHCCFYVPDTTS